jgi:hypothetical protein
MSGGQWNYVQDELMRIRSDIRMRMRRETYEKKEVYERLKQTTQVIAVAAIYIERVDLLFSGDDGYEEFLRRLNEELYKNLQWHNLHDF